MELSHAIEMDYEKDVKVSKQVAVNAVYDNSSQAGASSTQVRDVNRAGSSESRQQRFKPSQACGRCNSRYHQANSCPNRYKTCNSCGNVGHFAVKCRSNLKAKADRQDKENNPAPAKKAKISAVYDSDNNQEADSKVTKEDTT